MDCLAINASKYITLKDISIKFKNDSSQNWVLYDGGGTEKHSTNGTWVYVDD